MKTDYALKVAAKPVALTHLHFRGLHVGLLGHRNSVKRMLHDSLDSSHFHE